MLCREQWSLILIKTWKKNQSNFSSSKSWFQLKISYMTYENILPVWIQSLKAEQLLPNLVLTRIPRDIPEEDASMGA